MNITIDDRVLKKYSMSIEEFLILYLCAKEVDIMGAIDSIIESGIADRDLTNPVNAIVSNNVKELVSAVLIDSDKAVIDKDSEFNDVADAMRALYPSGRKPGTTYMWKDSTPIIARKLKTLVAKFDFHFTKEQAIDATKKYIDMHINDTQYMQLLKYFILKIDKTTGDLRSEFMSLIQNDGQENESEHSDDWLNEMR